MLTNNGDYNYSMLNGTGNVILELCTGENSVHAIQSVKKLCKRPCFCYYRGNGGVFMEGWRKDARREPIIVDLEALVPTAGPVLLP